MARINKELVAMNLLTCPTNKEAAEKSGVSITTLYRLKKDAEFQKVLQEVKNNIFCETITAETMLDGTPDAVKVACPV